jgi:hypothetical protein
MPSTLAKVFGTLFAFLLIASSALAQRNLGPQPNYGQPQGFAPPQNYGTTPHRYFSHGSARKEELEQQKQSFKQWWGDEFVTKLADLPAEGKVPEFRVPYAGHDYPDRAGGTINSLFKYDQAFHRGRQLAAEFERMDVGATPVGLQLPPGTATATAGQPRPFAMPSPSGALCATA